MTDNENQENGNSSNSKAPDIKNKNIQQQQQDINLQIGTSTSQEQKIEIVPTNEELVRSPKRSRIKESDESESSEKSEQDFFLGCEDLTGDPLLETEEILLKYNDFIEYVYQILKNDEKKQDWYEIIKRVQKLVNKLHVNLTVMVFDMECLEQHERFEKQYNFRLSHILNIIHAILQINIEITTSSSFKLVSDIKKRGKVLPVCLGEFERWRQQLSQLIDEMQSLKKMALEIDRDLDTEQTD